MNQTKPVTLKCEITEPEKRVCNCMAKLEILGANLIRINTKKKSFNVFLEHGYNPRIERITVPREKVLVTIICDGSF